MEYLTLQQTDLKVSKIALGCMRIADKSIEEVEELVKTALESGINFFDHADIYGGGKSEELFGEVLKRHPEYRKQMIIQTKCGIVPGKRYDFSKEHILKCVNESLERLHTDYVDILLLHRQMLYVILKKLLKLLMSYMKLEKFIILVFLTTHLYK